MSTPRKLERFLKKHHVQYEIIVHPTRYTNDEIAQVEHESGNHVAKVVIFKSKGNDLMAVLPASHSVDFLKMSAFLGTQDVQMESEMEFESLFPDCEVGAMPPFGKLYQMPCYVDRSLRDADEIVFNAGNHRESIKVQAKDFFRIVKAEIGDFAVPGKRMAV